jgi:hypothetical protein
LLGLQSVIMCPCLPNFLKNPKAAFCQFLIWSCYISFCSWVKFSQERSHTLSCAISLIESFVTGFLVISSDECPRISYNLFHAFGYFSWWSILDHSGFLLHIARNLQPWDTCERLFILVKSVPLERESEAFSLFVIGML